MAYNAVPTITTGDVATAAWGNTYIKDNFAAGVPDIFTTDGDMAVGTGANAAERVAVMNASNLLKHEVGGLEVSVAAVTTNDAVGGASSGVMEIKTPVTQAEAEAGSNTRFSLWSSERVGQAIAALAAGNDISVRVGSTGSQSIANATTTAIAFDEEDFDTNTIHDNSTNNTRLTCKTAGKYVIGGQISMANNATGRRRLDINKNGVGNIIAENEVGTNQNQSHVAEVSTIWDLDVDDYLELSIYQNSGGSLDCVRVADYQPIFWMLKVLG